MELMVVLAIIGILVAFAYPSYIDQVVKTKRKAAAACLTEYANYMERYYTTNLRYDQDAAATANTLPALDCTTDSNLDTAYSFTLPAGTLAQSTYILNAVPQGNQAGEDPECATLSLNQTGTRSVSGTDTADSCW